MKRAGFYASGRVVRAKEGIALRSFYLDIDDCSLFGMPLAGITGEQDDVHPIVIKAHGGLI